jgi:hypothetical protein
MLRFRLRLLCAEHDAAVAHYALGNFANRVLAREYQLTLPQEQHLIQRLEERRSSWRAGEQLQNSSPVDQSIRGFIA